MNLAGVPVLYKFPWYYSCPERYLAICAYRPSAVAQQLRHVVIAVKLPKAGLQVQVAVEPQRVGAPHPCTVLVWCCLANDLRVLGAIGDEAIASLDLIVIQQVGAAMVAHTSPVGAQSQLKIG